MVIERDPPVDDYRTNIVHPVDRIIYSQLGADSEDMMESDVARDLCLQFFYLPFRFPSRASAQSSIALFRRSSFIASSAMMSLTSRSVNNGVPSSEQR